MEIAHTNDMQADLSQKLLESTRKDLGRLDSLRAAILSLVVNENYQRAEDEMVAYVALKTAFPGFQERAERYIQHCLELIKAIQTKRRFPGIASLSLARQQEIYERVLAHFEDLKRHLAHIEKLEREQKLDDVRSTVWVVKASVYCVTFIFLVGLWVDIHGGAFSEVVAVTDSLMDSAIGAIVNFIKF